MDTPPGDAGLVRMIFQLHVVSDKWAGLGGVLLTAACDPAFVYKRMQHNLHLPCLHGVASLVRDDSKRGRLGSGVSKAKRTDNRSLTRGR